MARNIEIKARAADRDAVIRRLAALEVTRRETLRQRDVFFDAPDGRLKLRHFPDRAAELIFYRRPDQAGPGLSTWHRAPCGDGAAMHELLAAAFGVRGEVVKERILAIVGQTRVHLDRVQGLGDFVELEVVLEARQTPEDGHRIAAGLLAALGIADADLVDTAYIDLIEDTKR